MFKPKRLTLTLNSRQIADAQLIAALELIGGEATSAIKALALRGIMSDPSMSSVLAQGVAIMTTARKSKGSGWNPGKDWKPTEATSMSKPATLNSQPTYVSSITQIEKMPATVPSPVIQTLSTPAEGLVSAQTKAVQPIRRLSPIAVAAAAVDDLSDFLTP